LDNMSTQIRDNVIKQFVQQVREHFGLHLQQIILFGSRARGEHELDSDYDLLVILDKITPEAEKFINKLSGETLYKYNAVFSAFAYSEADLPHLKYEPFFMNAQKEGINL